jgi:hypothetical protein
MKLIANGSIDTDNNAYLLKDGELTKGVNCVITMQTRALLFQEIAAIVEKKYGKEIAMYATPIVASNDFFDHTVRSTTERLKHQDENE